MMPPQTEPMGDAAGNAKFKNTCDLLIFCEESDKHVRISWEDAMNATMISNATESKDVPDGKIWKGSDNDSATDVTMAGEMKLKTWREDAKLINQFNKGEKTWAELMANDGRALDCRIVLARPFVEHMMHSAILAVSGRSSAARTRAARAPTPLCAHPQPAASCAGRSTGATLFGPSDMQLSANTQVKT